MFFCVTFCRAVHEIASADFDDIPREPSLAGLLDIVLPHAMKNIGLERENIYEQERSEEVINRDSQ